MCEEARKWCNEPEGAMKRCVYRVYRGSEIVKSMQRNSEIGTDQSMYADDVMRAANIS